jgi:hypothetical protein
MKVRTAVAKNIKKEEPRRQPTLSGLHACGIIITYGY